MLLRVSQRWVWPAAGWCIRIKTAGANRSAIIIQFFGESILLAFISLIVVIGSMLNNNIPARIYKIIESILIAGIVLGVFGMFQPWLFYGYKYGFILLLVSLLLFIIWSHVSPRRDTLEQEEEYDVMGEGSPSNIESGSGV